MDFKNANELLALCRQEGCSISEIMRRRECILGETTVDTVTRRMKRALEIMRESATIPLTSPVRSMGGLIGGEARHLAAHAAKKKDICGPVLQKAITYAMAVLEVNASMGLIVAAPTAGSSGVLPGLPLAVSCLAAFLVGDRMTLLPYDTVATRAFFTIALVGYLGCGAAVWALQSLRGFSGSCLPLAILLFCTLGIHELSCNQAQIDFLMQRRGHRMD